MLGLNAVVLLTECRCFIRFYLPSNRFPHPPTSPQAPLSYFPIQLEAAKPEVHSDRRPEREEEEEEREVRGVRRRQVHEVRRRRRR